MDETTNLSASNESAAPADSGVTATTTAASGAGATTGEQSAQTQPAVAEAIAQQPADDQIDVGWSFGDEVGQDADLSDDDSDIEQMLTEPGVDPAKAPAVVQALRNARQQVRELSKQLKQASEPSQSQDFTPQQVEFVSRLLNPSEENGGIPAAMNALFQQARPLYGEIVNDVIAADPGYALERLRQMGALPEAFSQSQSPSSINPDDLAGLPEQLQAVANAMTPEDAAEFNELLSLEARAGFLNRLDRLNRMDAYQRQTAEAQWKQSVTQAREQGQQALQSLSEQYEKAHFAQLNKWSPFGPEDSEGNNQIYQSVIQGAFAEILGDQKFARMYQDTHQALSRAPERRLQNEGFAADQDERQARAWAAQFNARLGQVMKTRIEKLDSVFKDARAYREQQRQNAPQRTEISGQSAQIQNGKVNALDSKGRVTDAYLEDLTARLNLNAGR